MALTPEQETEIWDLYLKRTPQTAIAKQVKVNRNTVSTALHRIKRELADSRKDEMDDARAEALAEYDLLKREAWRRLETCDAPSTAAVGYLGAILEARKAQDRLLGLEEITVNVRGLHLARIEAIMTTPVPVRLIAEDAHG